MAAKRVNIIISGMVQGVSFRYFVVRHARLLGLRGYARNIDDDKVEVVAEGEESKLGQLIELCRKGPSMAVVKDIEVKFEKAEGEFSDFKINY
jgi:acylphosphatase